MKILYPLALLVALTGISPTAAQEEDSTKLNSYKVGDRRNQIETEKFVMERPKFENNFKVEITKPTMGTIQIAKPQLEIVTGPAPAGPTADAPGRTASADTRSAPAAGSNETRSVQPLRMDAPEYPRDALRRGEEGHVIVEFTINGQGRTEDISIVESEPRGSFENEARRAVSRWTFEPALRDGRPVPQRIRHTLEFTLNR